MQFIGWCSGCSMLVLEVLITEELPGLAAADDMLFGPTFFC